MGPKVQDQLTLDEFVNHSGRMFQTLTNTLQQVRQDSANQNQQITTALAALHPPLDLNPLTRAVGRTYRPKLPDYLPSRPHFWANQVRNAIERWSADHLTAITQDPVTNPNTDPPTLVWADEQAAEFITSKEVFLELYATLPLQKQAKVDLAMATLASARSDDLLNYSAYHGLVWFGLI